MATRYDRIEQRLMAILGKQDADDLFRGEANLKRYLKYLKEHLAFPCLLTGMEDFPWEERYVFGVIRYRVKVSGLSCRFQRMS